MSLSAFGAKIKVIGIGGGGGNAVNTMIKSGLEGVQFIVANTDSQALQASLAHHKVQLGKELTKGLGAGADPDIGRDAALEDRHELQELLSDADMVFITAGMGGGTGTGAAAVVAQIARELGALTVAVVTKPFTFEGKRRRRHAEMGIARLREAVDTLITIPNQRLLQIATPDLSMLDAFKLADNVLVNAVRGISDIINTPGLINVDFADVKTVMSSMGHALMGIGYGQGPDRALTAAKQAISSPLLEDIDIEGATGILINITAGTNVSIMEVNNACMVIQEASHEDANIIFGAVIDESLGEEIRITVIATGFPVDDSQTVDESHGMSLAQTRIPGSHSGGYLASSARSNPAALAAQVARPFNNSRPITHQSTSRASNVHSHSGNPTPSSKNIMNQSSGSHYNKTPQQQVTEASGQSNLRASELPPTPSMNVFQEARDLAAWSLTENSSRTDIPGEAELLSKLATHENTGSHVFAEATKAFNNNGHLGLELEDHIVEDNSSDVFQEESLASMVFKDSRDASTVKADSSVETPRAGAFAQSDSLPWVSEQSPSDSVTAEIDRKIDEALALASRLNSSSAGKAGPLGDVDDLDLPAFLRHGTSELPK
jgi:cell division protein FtsZ